MNICDASPSVFKGEIVMSGYRRSFPKGASERMCALMSEARNISELKRAQCIYFRSEHGLPPQQIADMVGFDVGTVRNLHSAFLRDGEAALKLSGNTPMPMAPSVLATAPPTS